LPDSRYVGYRQFWKGILFANAQPAGSKSI